jgi:hypothetical protein
MADTLGPNQSLGYNQSITSQSGVYQLIMQTDGNLVIYKHIPGQPSRPIWATNTSGTDCNRVIMQNDGNFVLYRVNNTAAWSSGTYGKNGSSIIMQNDGNLVIYQPHVPVWASNTVQG